MRSLNLILLSILIFTQAFGQAKFQPDDLRIKPKTTVTRPTGVEGQFFTDKTTHKFYYFNGTTWLDALLSSSISDTAYDATSWNGVTTTSPSKNAVRDILESMIADIALKAPLANPTFSGTVSGTFSGNLTGNVTGNVTGAVTGNSSTATALAADPADCLADTYATAINASGTLSCGTVTSAGLAGSIDASKIADGTVSSSEFQFINSLTSNAQTQLTSKITNPMTTLGDWMYGAAAGAPTRIAGNITTTAQTLIQTGDGVNSAAPTLISVTSTNTNSSIVARDGSGNFTASTITGALSGNATTATTATNATNTAITDDTTTSATMYPTWVTAATGNLPQKVSSTKMSFNPSTGTLTLGTATSAIGKLVLSGNTSGAITVAPQAAAGTYNFNLPTTAGTAGQALLSGGGSGAPMTWGTAGGGGSAVRWYATSGTAPSEGSTNGVQIWGFVAAQAGVEILNGFVKVPASYIAGNPITVKVAVFSSATSNTILFSSTSYLITKDSTAITSTTNSRNSTNVALTNSATSAKYRQVDLDVSSSIGQINAVAIAAGDLIRVKVFRGTDTDTTTLFFVPDATEVTFQ